MQDSLVLAVTSPETLASLPELALFAAGTLRQYYAVDFPAEIGTITDATSFASFYCSAAASATYDTSISSQTDVLRHAREDKRFWSFQEATEITKHRHNTVVTMDRPLQHGRFP
jgi:hypothetical protein